MQMTIIPLCHTHPIRAELELQEFGRHWFVKQWDVKAGNVCISAPVQTFIDGFGLYRNSYRSLMGGQSASMGTLKINTYLPYY